MLANAMHNDLQAPAIHLEPSLADVLELGEQNGALAGIVSGSGPTVAFLAADVDSALELQVALSAARLNVVRATGPVHGARVVAIDFALDAIEAARPLAGGPQRRREMAIGFADAFRQQNCCLVGAHALARAHEQIAERPFEPGNSRGQSGLGHPDLLRRNAESPATGDLSHSAQMADVEQKRISDHK